MRRDRVLSSLVSAHLSNYLQVFAFVLKADFLLGHFLPLKRGPVNEDKKTSRSLMKINSV